MGDTIWKGTALGGVIWVRALTAQASLPTKPFGALMPAAMWNDPTHVMALAPSYLAAGCTMINVVGPKADEVAEQLDKLIEERGSDCTVMPSTDLDEGANGFIIMG